MFGQTFKRSLIIGHFSKELLSFRKSQIVAPLGRLLCLFQENNFTKNNKKRLKQGYRFRDYKLWLQDARGSLFSPRRLLRRGENCA
jgi:hypothetical protein